MKKYILLIFLLLILILFRGVNLLSLDYGHYLNYSYIIKYPNIRNLDYVYLNKYKKLNDASLKRLKVDYKIINFNDVVQIDYKIIKQYKDKIKEEHDIVYYENSKLINRDSIIKNKSAFERLLKEKIKEKYDVLIDDMKYDLLFKKDTILIKGLYDIEIKYDELINIIDDRYLNNNNPIIKEYILKKQKYQNKKLIAITFDDGPSKYTEYLLDELKKRDVKVTFFLVGYNILKYPEIIKRMALENHELGNHTYNHHDLKKLNKVSVKEEIEKVNELIYKYSNYRVKLIRPPYGNITSDIMKNNNYYYILWSVDTLDWKYRNANKVYNNIIKDVQDGDIVLLHDLYKTSIEGVLKAIDELKKQDFEFVTVSNLALFKNKKINTNTKYANLR